MEEVKKKKDISWSLLNDHTLPIYVHRNPNADQEVILSGESNAHIWCLRALNNYCEYIQLMKHSTSYLFFKFIVVMLLNVREERNSCYYEVFSYNGKGSM